MCDNVHATQKQMAKGRGGSYWSCRTTIRLEGLVHILGIAKRVDMTVKLEKLVFPPRAEEDDHAQIDQKIKDEVDTGHGHEPAHRVDRQCKEGEEGEVAEPDHVADSQNHVQGEGSATVLNLVHLTHLVQQVHQDEQTVCQIEPTSPALVAVVQADGQREHLL